MMVYSKGQTRVIGEMLLFAIGVMILSYIMIIFGIVQTGVYDLSVTDQLQSTALFVKSTAVKLTNAEDAVSSMIIELPLRLSGEEYGIKLQTVGEAPDIKYLVNVSILADPDTFVTEVLFNTGSDYIIQETVLRSSSIYYVVKLEKKGNEKELSMEYYKFPEP